MIIHTTHLVQRDARARDTHAASRPAGWRVGRRRLRRSSRGGLPSYWPGGSILCSSITALTSPASSLKSCAKAPAASPSKSFASASAAAAPTLSASAFGRADRLVLTRALVCAIARSWLARLVADRLLRDVHVCAYSWRSTP